ncbi:nucleolar protein 58-like [Montipora foliosa]|uniref:nucleolar protein 58-like n=1 Tax=Montipora foliosa TaxID=591990 RepID=UPI0035F1F61F
MEYLQSIRGIGPTGSKFEAVVKAREPKIAEEIKLKALDKESKKSKRKEKKAKTDSDQAGEAMVPLVGKGEEEKPENGEEMNEDKIVENKSKRKDESGRVKDDIEEEKAEPNSLKEEKKRKKDSRFSKEDVEEDYVPEAKQGKREKRLQTKEEMMRKKIRRRELWRRRN